MFGMTQNHYLLKPGISHDVYKREAIQIHQPEPLPVVTLRFET